MSVQAVTDTMYRLNEVHMILLDLAEEKREALVHNRVDELNQIVHQENKLLKQVTELDAQRVEAIGHALVQRGYTPNPRVTVSDLIRLIFKAEDKKALMDAQTMLLSTIKTLQEKNALNEQLIQQSLSFIEYSLNLMIGAPEDDAVYQNPTQQHNMKRNQSFFDSRA